MSEYTYAVAGMTCDRCADAVGREISTVAGVRRVAVDVPSGQVTVNSDVAPPIEQVRAAVAEAGFDLLTR